MPKDKTDNFLKAIKKYAKEQKTAMHGEVKQLKTERLKEAEKDEYSGRMTERFLRSMAERTLSMNDRIQVLSRYRLRDRILLLLSQYRNGSRTEVDIPFSRNDLAIYLGANRCAVSRELACMKKDGLIDYSGRHFSLFFSEEE